MRNMNLVKSFHNRSILNPPKTEFGCNCRDKADRLLYNKCLTSSIAYQADVTNSAENKKRIYLGVSETTVKEIYGYYIKERKHERYCNANALF